MLTGSSLAIADTTDHYDRYDQDHHHHHHPSSRESSSSSFRKDIHILLYDHDSTLEHDPTSSLHFFKDRSAFAQVRTTVYGGWLKHSGSSNGDKLRLLEPFLEVARPDELIVVANAREVLLNIAASADTDTHTDIGNAVDAFLQTFRDLTEDHPDAVVLSAEDEHHHHKAYLNSGILAGYPKGIMELLRNSNIDANTDEHAVLADLMTDFPEMIQLDYHQELFGTNSVGKGLEEGCVFETTDHDLPLVHSYHGTSPLLLHTPGNFYDCLDTLIDELGGTSQQRYLVDYGAGEAGIERRSVAFQEDPIPRARRAAADVPNGQAATLLSGAYGFFQNLVLIPTGVFGRRNGGNYGNYGNSGQYGQYGNYGQYGQYGLVGQRQQGAQSGMDGAYGFFTQIIGKYVSVANYGIYFDFIRQNNNYGQYGSYEDDSGESSSTPENENAGGVEEIEVEGRAIDQARPRSTAAPTATPTETPTWAPTTDYPTSAMIIDEHYASWYYDVFAKVWPWADNGDGDR